MRKTYLVLILAFSALSTQALRAQERVGIVTTLPAQSLSLPANLEWLALAVSNEVDNAIWRSQSTRGLGGSTAGPALAKACVQITFACLNNLSAKQQADVIRSLNADVTITTLVKPGDNGQFEVTLSALDSDLKIIQKATESFKIDDFSGVGVALKAILLGVKGQAKFALDEPSIAAMTKFPKVLPIALESMARSAVEDWSLRFRADGKPLSPAQSAAADQAQLKSNEAIVKLDSTSYAAWSGLGWIRLNTRNADGALQAFERSAALESNNPAGRIGVAFALAAKDQVGKAISAARPVVAQYPQYLEITQPWIQWHQADTASKANLPVELAAARSMLARQRPEHSIDLSLMLASMDYADDKNQAALDRANAVISILQKIETPATLATSRRWAEANDVAARASVDLDKEPASVTFFERAISTYVAINALAKDSVTPSLGSLRLNFSYALVTLKRDEDALRQAESAQNEFESALGLANRSTVQSMARRGALLNRLKRYPEANLWLSKTLLVIDDDKLKNCEAIYLTALRDLNTNYESQKKWTDQKRVLTTLLERTQADKTAGAEKIAPIQRDIADNLVALKDYPAAIAAYQQEIKLRLSLAKPNLAAAAYAWERIAQAQQSSFQFKEALVSIGTGLSYRQKVLAELPAQATQANKNQAIRNVVTALRIHANIHGDLSEYPASLALYEQALATAKTELPVSDRSIAASATTLGFTLRKLDRLNEAIAQYELALKLYEAMQPPEQELIANAAANLGVAYLAADRHGDSLKFHQKALAIRKRVLPANHPDIASSLQNLAAVYVVLDQFPKALEAATEAVVILASSSGPTSTNTLLARERLASVYNAQGNESLAGKEFMEVLAIREKLVGKNHQDYLSTLSNVADSAYSRGDYASALELSTEVIAGYRRLDGEKSANMASALSTLANIYEKTGRFSEALAARQKTQQIIETIAGADSSNAASNRGKIAKIYIQLGDYQRAEPLLEAQLAARIKLYGLNDSSTAAALIETGDVLFRTKRQDLALRRYEQALKINESVYGNDSVAVSKTLGYIAEYYLEKKQYAKALPMLEQSYAIDTKLLGPMHPNTAASLNNLAAVYYAAGEEERSLPLVLRAALVAQVNGNPRTSATYLMNLTRNYAYLNQRPSAIIFGKQAINLFQKIRGQSQGLDQALQKTLLQSNLKSYRFVADLLTQEGRLAEAQEVLAMLKEEEYFDFIRRDASDKPVTTLSKITPAEAPWLDRYNQIGTDIARIARELGELRQASGDVDGKSKKLEADLSIANAAFDRITGDMLKAFKDNKARQMTSQKIEAQGALQETLGELGKGVALVQYLVLPSRVGIILTTSGVQIARESVIEEEALNKKVAAYREAVFNPKIDPTPLAQELYQLLIAPISKDLQAGQIKTLMLSLDGTLRYLPFAALHDGERYLIERTQLALYNDAARDKLKDKASTNMRVWGMGLTKAVSGFTALAGVKGELDAIVSNDGIKGQIYLDDAFTEQALQTGLTQKFPVLHIASHFKFSPGTEADSFLLMGDGSKLSLRDIRTKYRFAGVDMLTLSACETAFGGGQDANGREIEGFATLAQNRGAKSVLATLWPVADQSTSHLMQTLYRSRGKEQLSKAAALQKAQLSLLRGFDKAGASVVEEDNWRSASRPAVRGGAGLPAFAVRTDAPHAHPYYWAPFILMGNWL